MAPASKLKSGSVGNYRYFTDCILGKGNFATVYLAHHKIVKCDVALKIIDKKNITEDYVFKNLDRESGILEKLHHPNIIRLYEVVKEGNLYCLSLELVRGVNLYNYMNKLKTGYISERIARLFFYQMLSAVEYMHNLNIMHRDLKLENILLEFGHIIKIADFGLSNTYYPSTELRTHCGSVEYAAPELFRPSAYGTAADVWSLGVVLYAMVVGRMPFRFNRRKETCIKNPKIRQPFIQRISKGLTQNNWEQMEHLSADCWDLLHSMLQPDQFKRIRIEDAITHPWIVNDCYLERLLPRKRRDLQRKLHPEITEYLAYKLNKTVSRIENHLNVYSNDKVGAMYFIVRDALMKEILYPLKNSQTSFLHRFQSWRENLNSRHLMQKYIYENGVKKKENFFSKECLPFSSREDSIRNIDAKNADNFKLQSLTRTILKATVLSSKYSNMKFYRSTREDNNNDNANKQQLEKDVLNKRYKSYIKSRPENVRSSNNIHQEITKNNMRVDKMKSISGSHEETPIISNNKEFAKNYQNFYQNSLSRESDNIRQDSTRYDRVYSSRISAVERNKLKYSTYTKTKPLANDINKVVKKCYSEKVETKPNLSVKELLEVKNPCPQKITILKRTVENPNTKEKPKVADENCIDLQATPRKPNNNFKKINDVSKIACAQTPSRIPVKIMQYGSPAPFSQQSILSARKSTKLTGPGRKKFCRGDTIEEVK